MEGHISRDGWWVVRFSGKVWRTLETHQRQIVGGQDDVITAMPDMTFSVRRGLGCAIINDARAGPERNISLCGPKGMIDVRNSR